MKYPSLPSFKTQLILAAAVLCASLSAQAACPTPASGKLVICQPSASATVYQVPHIEAVANPSSGSITSMKVYVDNKIVFSSSGAVIDLFEGGVVNGTHHLSVNAWDDFGRLYRAEQVFAVTGNLPSCPPTAVGVRICAPGAGQTASQNLALSLGFKGNAPIKRVTAYIGSTPVFDLPVAPGQTQVLGSGSATTAGTHTLNVVARDTNNVAYKSSISFKAYYEGDCPPKGGACNPGIYPNTPNDGEDVQSPFRVSAGVQFNTASITAMKVYVDGLQAGASSGPTLDQPVNAARGTHILVIQAWDTAGKLYRFTENVNVQ
ncbi:MAG TPA: hypothetical protein VKH81_17155 [Candidatus Angelobacter sp.]|nr:hypothetical protein [Candidatus Angelobacter sp.]